MKQFFRLTLISVLTALGFSSCVGCMPGLVYGPPPRDNFDTIDSTQVELPANAEKTIETTAP